jgi:hypothetical protein
MNSNVPSGNTATLKIWDKFNNFFIFCKLYSHCEFHFFSHDKVSQIVAADFMLKSSGLELFRLHDNVHRLRSKSTPYSLQFLLYNTISTAVRFLSNRRSHLTAHEIVDSVLYEDHSKEIFGLIANLITTPSIKLEPAFRPRWTHYTATVPYDVSWLNLKVILNEHAAYALLENERHELNQCFSCN